MGLVIVDLVLDALSLHLVAGFAGRVQIAEQHAEFAGVGLAQEGVELLDEGRHGGLLMHGLVGQRAEFGAQRRDHPARQIEIAPLGRAEMLLDGDHLLLADETMPAAERLGVLGRIGIIGRHVLAHDLRRVFGDVEPGLELVLGAHAGDRLGLDGAPGIVLLLEVGDVLDVALIGRHLGCPLLERNCQIL